jgi:DNA primase
MTIKDNVLNEIREKAYISDVVNEYVPLKKKGARYWGLCPFHNEKTPSFTVTPEKNLYYCHGCHKGGDVIDFIMEMEKLPFVDAVRLLAEKLGIQIEEDDGGYKKEKSNRDALLELYRGLSTSFHYLLMNSKEAEPALKYIRNRAISQETIEEFKLGYIYGNREWLYKFLKPKNYSDQVLSESGLFSVKGGTFLSFFFDRLLFPIVNLRGDTIGFGGRTLNDKGPKYLNTAETSIFRKGENLYGINLALPHIKEKKQFYLVEGYVDVLSLYQSGVKNCVAPLGTAFTDNQAKLLHRYADEAVLVFDSDDAGFKATLRAMEILEVNQFKIEVLEVVNGKDPADILQKEGPDALNNLTKYSINGFQYLLNKALSKFGSGTPAGNENIVRFVFPYLAKVESKVKRDGYFSILADSIQVDVDLIKEDFGNNTNRTFLKPKKEPSVKEDGHFSSDEMFLALALSVNREYYAEVRNKISIDGLEDRRAKDIFIALEECYRKDEKGIELLLAKIEDKDLVRVILEKNSGDEYAMNPGQMIQDAVARIKKKILGKKRDNVYSQIKKCEKAEPWKMKDLLIEKMILDKEFEELRVFEHEKEQQHQ